MSYSIDKIYQSLASPRDDASFFKALADECRSIGRESKNENLTETAFYQVASTMDNLYRDKKISLTCYHSITFVYQNWSLFRLEIGNINGWREIANKGLDLALTYFEESIDWKYSYLFFIYNIFVHTEGIEERWQQLSSSFIPVESIGKFMDCPKNLCRGVLLMETALLMEKRGFGSDVKSSITFVLKAAEVLRNCYDNHIEIYSPPTSAATALKTLSDYYIKNQTRYRRFDESKASRIEELLRIKTDSVVKASPSVPKGKKTIHPGVFITIVMAIIILCVILIFRELASNSEIEKPSKDQIDNQHEYQVQPVHEESIQEQIEKAKSASIPFDVTGLYFVLKADGVSTKGVTARISEVEGGKYDMAVYSNIPIRHYIMSLDRAKGLFHNEELGNGYITYDEQTKSITINFSDLWLLTN